MVFKSLSSWTNTAFKVRLHIPSMSPFFNHLKGIECGLLMLFTHNVKKINGAANENGDVGGTCKQGLTENIPVWSHPQLHLGVTPLDHLKSNSP